MRVRALIVGLAMISAAAHAEPKRTGKDAAKLFERGRALVKAGKIDEACPLFQQSFDLDPAVGTELNLADCHERLGHLAEAWRMFDDAAIKSGKDGNAAREAVARDRATALLPKLGTIVVELADPNATGLELTIGGAAAPAAAQVERKVDPGATEITAHVPDHPAFETTVQVAATKTVIVRVPSFTAAAPPAGPGLSAAPVAPPPAAPNERPRAHGRVVLALVTGGVGVAALATSVGLGIVAHGRYQDALGGGCTQTGSMTVCPTQTGVDRVNSSISLANAATIAGLAGGALAIAGALLYVTAPRETIVAPVASANSAGVMLRASF